MALDKYKYGIFYRINKNNGWNENQIKMYMDKQGIKYHSEDTREDLIELIKSHEDSKEQEKELEEIVKEITEEAKKVVEDYVINKSELSGSLTQVHESSPLLEDD